MAKWQNSLLPSTRNKSYNFFFLDFIPKSLYQYDIFVTLFSRRFYCFHLKNLCEFCRNMLVGHVRVFRDKYFHQLKCTSVQQFQKIIATTRARIWSVGLGKFAFSRYDRVFLSGRCSDRTFTQHLPWTTDSNKVKVKCRLCKASDCNLTWLASAISYLKIVVTYKIANSSMSEE